MYDLLDAAEHETVLLLHRRSRNVLPLLAHSQSSLQLRAAFELLQPIRLCQSFTYWVHILI